jgi:hypothetical protein
MTLAICELEKGYVVCVCDEHGEPLMQVTQGFGDWCTADRVRRIIDSARFSGLGSDLLRELQMAEVIQPLAIGFEGRV